MRREHRLELLIVELSPTITTNGAKTRERGLGLTRHGNELAISNTFSQLVMTVLVERFHNSFDEVINNLVQVSLVLERYVPHHSSSTINNDQKMNVAVKVWSIHFTAIKVKLLHGIVVTVMVLFLLQEVGIVVFHISMIHRSHMGIG